MFKVYIRKIENGRGGPEGAVMYISAVQLVGQPKN